MARQCFYSFHYQPDNWRAAKVRNIGVIEGNQPAKDNDWESVTRGGDVAIQKWIDDQMAGRTCTILLIGANTAGRKWINYEIEKSWNSGKGLVGIHINKIHCRDNRQSAKGSDPFSGFTLKNGTIALSSVVKSYDPPDASSQDCYNYIANNIANWVEEAIKIRANN